MPFLLRLEIGKSFCFLYVKQIFEFGSVAISLFFASDNFGAWSSETGRRQNLGRGPLARFEICTLSIAPLYQDDASVLGRAEGFTQRTVNFRTRTCRLLFTRPSARRRRRLRLGRRQ